MSGKVLLALIGEISSLIAFFFSCRKRSDKWIVAMNKWQTMTDMEVNKETLDMLSEYCRLG